MCSVISTACILPVSVCVPSVRAVSTVVSGLSGLYQQLWSWRAAVTVESIGAFSTWRGDTGAQCQ